MLSHILIYVSIYVLKNSAYICLVTYMLAYMWTYMVSKNPHVFVLCHICYYIMFVCPYMLSHIMTYMNVSCLCVSIYVLKKVYVTIYVNIYGLKKPHIFCIVSYVLLYNFRLPICCHIYRLIWMSVFYMWGYMCSKIRRIFVLWHICYHICEHIRAQKSTHICLVSYMLLYNVAT